MKILPPVQARQMKNPGDGENDATVRFLFRQLKSSRWSDPQALYEARDQLFARFADPTTAEAVEGLRQALVTNQFHGGRAANDLEPTNITGTLNRYRWRDEQLPHVSELVDQLAHVIRPEGSPETSTIYTKPYYRVGIYARVTLIFWIECWQGQHGVTIDWSRYGKKYTPYELV